MARLYDRLPVLKPAASLILALALASQFFFSALRAEKDVAATQTSQPARAARPKLVVLISIDQMRGDYVDHYGHQWSKGLKRLIAEGAWFRQADYPHYTTVTCPGHASISTGTVPAVHGMVENQWLDRATGRLTSCTTDEAEKLVTYGAAVTGAGHSARRLMTTAFADELRLQSAVAPRVVSISLKARSAITLGGHKPDAVIWLDEADGEWVTSTAFANEPAKYFADYIAAHPLRSEMGRTWDRSLPIAQYIGDYSSENRRRYALVTREFPHVVKGRGDEVRGAFTDAWESSPYSDAYLAGLATAALDGLKLGRGRGTDLLAIGFSALDKTGHDFGPDSHEVQDVLIHVDAQIGALLDKLDREVGKGNYVVALSSDHGVAPVPERMRAQGFDAGRVNTAAVGRAIDGILQRELGPGTYRTRVQYNDIYFDNGVYDRLAQNARAMSAVLEVIRTAEGIASVHRKEELSRVDPLTRPLALSYYEGRSGDMKIIVRPYWIASASTSTHGTGHRYDSRVPVILFGYGIKQGEYIEPASPIDMAPTLAFLTGVTLPNPTGRVLTEALTPPR